TLSVSSLGNGDPRSPPKFGLRRHRFPLDIRNTYKRKQCDGTHGHPTSIRHCGMRQLMRHNAAEEKQSRDRRYSPCQRRTPLWVDHFKMSDQRKKDQQGDNEPAEMYSDVDAENPAKSDGRPHNSSSGPLTMF